MECKKIGVHLHQNQTKTNKNMENLANTMTKQEKLMYDYTFKFYINNNFCEDEAKIEAEKKVQGMRKVKNEMKKIGFTY